MRFNKFCYLIKIDSNRSIGEKVIMIMIIIILLITFASITFCSGRKKESKIRRRKNKENCWIYFSQQIFIPTLSWSSDLLYFLEDPSTKRSYWWTFYNGSLQNWKSLTILENSTFFYTPYPCMFGFCVLW